MLEAIARRKLTEHNIREDPLTDSTFSPLMQFSPTSAWFVLKTTLVVDRIDSEPLCRFENQTPKSHQISLWPRLQYDDNFVEPDVLVTFDFGDIGKLSILIEVKWNANIGHNQITKQRDAFRKSSIETAHKFAQVLLTKKKLPCRNSVHRDKIIGSGTISLCTWGEFADRLNKNSYPQEVRPWQTMLIRAFSQFNIAAFEGFRTAPLEKKLTKHWIFREINFRINIPQYVKWKFNYE